MKEKTLAFFDLDETLISINSGTSWMQREKKLGRINNWHMLQGGLMLAFYKFGIIDIEAAFTKALATVKGIEEKDIEAQTKQWFFEEVTKFACPGAWVFLEAHRAAGHELILLTSSSPYAGSSAVEFFNLDAALTSKYETQDGRFTGKPVSPICYGKGKIYYAKQYADEKGSSLNNAYFYTDSNTDLPMLEAVAHPRVVHPDPRLQISCLMRGWPVLNWKSKSLGVTEQKLLQEVR
jgi:HAD superfamily hydrolase (TIGR01490 family)